MLKEQFINDSTLEGQPLEMNHFVSEGAKEIIKHFLSHTFEQCVLLIRFRSDMCRVNKEQRLYLKLEWFSLNF